MPSSLPNVNKIIYSDVDVLNLKDLTEMYNINLKEKIYFAGTLDHFSSIREIRQFGNHYDKYINSGILLMNLKAMREDSIEQKLIDFISNHNVTYCDQDTINVVCNNNIQVLSYKYAIKAFRTFESFVSYNNHQNEKYRFNESELKEAYNDTTFYHYAGFNKPWHHNYFKSNRKYWWYYAKISGFYQEILDYYKFNINDIDNLLRTIPQEGGVLKRNYKKFF